MGKTDKHKDTINQIIESSCKRYGNRPALGMAFEKPLTYLELREKISLMASRLESYGLKKSDRAAILAENSPNWGIAYLAIVGIGAVAVPILPDFAETDVHHILNESKAKFIFTTRRQIDKIYELPIKSIKHVITLDDWEGENDPFKINTFSNCLSEASQTAAKKTVPAPVYDDDLASIIYTSGTSGHAKAVKLSHKNYFANVHSADLVADVKEEWTFLSILPMSHTYEFTVGFLLPLLNGARVVYAGKTPTPGILERICREEKPDVMCIVPLVMEKIYKKRVLAAINKNRFLRIVVKVPALRRKIFQKIGRRLLTFFGGRLKLLAIGGAAINMEVEKFLLEAGFPYIIGYGMTEACPLLAGGPFKDPEIAIGSTGKPVPGVDIKIVNKDPQTGIGEIYARGPNIMAGYYNNPELTRETIIDGEWLATGDLGRFDRHGNLHIKGRIKSVIVLSNGENIYPEAIEDKINAFIEVVESLVVENNGRLEAIVYLDYDLIDRKTAGKNQPQKLEYIKDLLRVMQGETNRQLPSFSQISKFIERREPFIKTATHKIKRYLYS